MDYLSEVKEWLKPTRQYDIADTYQSIYGNDFLNKKGYFGDIKRNLDRVVNSGHGVTETKHSILTSPHFVDRLLRVGSADSRQTSESRNFFYKAVLGREPTEDEEKNEYPKIYNTESALKAIQEVTNSGRYRNQIVKDLFTELLNRPVDIPGEDYYMKRLTEGASVEDIAAEIRNSTEYKNLPQDKKAKYVYKGKPINEALANEFKDADLVKGDGKYSFFYTFPGQDKYRESLPEHLDGMFLQTGNREWTEDALRAMILTAGPEQGRLIAEAMDRKVPIILGDIEITQAAEFADLAAKATVIAAEALLGASVLAAEVKHVPKMDLTRRRFLQLGGLGLGLVGAARLLAPLAGKVVEATDSGTDLNTAKPVIRTLDKFHPEVSMVVDNTRNMILAEKAEWLQKKWGGNKHFGMVLSTGNVGIENDIESNSSDRLSTLGFFKDIILKTVNDPESLYTIAVCRKDETGKFVVEKHVVLELYDLFHSPDDQPR